VGELPVEVRQALVAWDGWDVASMDLAQRESLGLPPHRRALRLDGPSDAIDEAVLAVDSAEPSVSRDAQGAWIVSSRGAMPGIVEAVRAVVVSRSLRSATPLYVKVDATPSV
jgi:primosomal protein N' (replication factor Y)